MIARNQVVGLIAGVVLIVAALTGALLVGSDAPHSSPEAVVRSYLVAIYEKGDASQYLALFNPLELQELEAEYGIAMEDVRDELQTGLDGFHLQLASAEISLTWEVDSTTVQNGTAQTIALVTYTHLTHGDSEDAEIIDTVERDGRWYLQVEALEAFVRLLAEWRAAAKAP